MGLRLLLLCLIACAPTVAAAKGTIGVGDIAPEILGYTIDKEPIVRDDYQGTVVIMTFWATWCAPCRKEIPILAAMAEMTDDKDLKVIAVSYKESRSVAKKVTRKLKDTQVTFAYDRRSKLSKAFKIKSIPNLWIIGRDGRILYNKTGYGEEALPGLVDKVNAALLGELTPNEAR